jgi:hypothetical protein
MMFVVNIRMRCPFIFQQIILTAYLRVNIRIIQSMQFFLMKKKLYDFDVQ